MRKLKVIQIGIGHDHAPLVIENIRKQKSIFDVCGYVIPECEKELYAGRLSLFDGLTEYNIEEALSIEGLDAVVVETEEKNLLKYAIMAAKRGFHIHMDKPGSPDAKDFETLISIVRKNKTVFHLGYMYRYNPAVCTLMEKIHSGELGEIYSVEAHMSCNHTKTKREWLSQFKGGMMFFLGCHLIDLVLQIQGIPEKIIPFNKKTGTEGVKAEDFSMVLFEYKNGVSFAKTCASEIGGYHRRQLVVCGSKGTYEIKPFEKQFPKEADGTIPYTTGISEVYKKDTDGKRWAVDCREFSWTDTYDRYDLMMESFAKMALGEIDNPYTYDYELMLYKTLMKACGINN